MSELEASRPKGPLSSIRLDATYVKSVEEAAAPVKEEFGPLDVLVNNARVGNMDDKVRPRIQLYLETNVMGPAMVAAAFRPLLLRSRNPYSTYVSSGAGTLVRNAAQRPPTHGGIKNGDAYPVRKAALNMLAVLEAGVHGSKGLRVFVMNPRFVQSNLRRSTEEARSGWGKAADPEISG